MYSEVSWNAPEHQATQLDPLSAIPTAGFSAVATAFSLSWAFSPNQKSIMLIELGNANSPGNTFGT